MKSAANGTNAGGGGDHGSSGDREEVDLIMDDTTDIDDDSKMTTDTVDKPDKASGDKDGKGQKSSDDDDIDDDDNMEEEEEDEEGEDDEDGSEEEGSEEEEDSSSDLDADECEKKRNDFTDGLGELEKQFAILREQLYRERITQIEAKLEEVRYGKAPEYLIPLEELQVHMKERLETGTILRDLRLQNIQCKYDAEMLATEQNFKSEKELIWDSLKADLEEKIHLLEEDKHNVDFSSGLWEATSGRSRKRKADPMDPDRRKKPVTVCGPYVVYMLDEVDILDDWTAIKKSLTQKRKIQVH